jgi:3-oxoacyl-[acyl-carrier protein] reductase
MNTGLQGVGVVVTGASGGIGQAIARAFAGEGARVALHYHRNREAAEALARELGDGCVALGADLRDEAQTEALFTQAAQRVGRIDALVANAGMRYRDARPLHEMELGQWRATIEGDLTSVFLTCRAFMRGLAQTPRDAASIVLIGSTAAVFGEAGYTDYASAKAGMTYGMTRSLKNEIVHLAPRGRVNCVCPGWTRTPMAREATSDPATLARVQATIPLNKIATPEDVASAVVYLSSDTLAGHVSGLVLPVAGGMEGRVLR